METKKTGRYLVLLIFLTLNLVFTIKGFSQGTSINNNGAAATGSALLDVTSTTHGIRIPRVALTGTTDIVTVPNPVNSLLVFDTLPAGDITEKGFYYWDAGNSKWVKLATGSSSGSGGGFGMYQVFDANGTFTVPGGVTKIKVELWGGGAGGGLGTNGGGGGGGGAYINAILNNLVSSYAVTVGGGGGGGVSGGNGSNSIFSGGTITLTANGGIGAVNGGTGGAGGSTSITGTPLTYFTVNGTPGGHGASSVSNAGCGGSGGNGGGGGSGGSNAICSTKGGVIPGGGGGGSSATCGAGGNGARGRVIVWY